MVDDATPEELWQRLAEESPHTSDVTRSKGSSSLGSVVNHHHLLPRAAKAKQDFIRQITEWVFKRPASETLRADSRAVSFPRMPLKD